MDRKSLKIKSLILIILVFAFTSQSCFFRSDSEISRIADEEIRQSKDLQNLERMCSQLPILGGLTPEKKSIGRKGNILFYHYSLDQDFNQFKSTYKDILLREGWTLTKEESGVWEEQIEFEKETLRIHISYGYAGKGSYGLSCEYKSRAR